MSGHLLVLVRHAKSDWSGSHADRDRPVGARGRRQAPESGRWLAEHLPDLELAVVSPALRARTTWELMAAELPAPPPVRYDDAVYDFSAGPVLTVVRGLPEDARAVAVVGHNPALEDLARRLTGGWVDLPTSTLAVVELDGAWASAGDGHARLLAVGRPPEGGLGEARSGTPSR